MSSLVLSVVLTALGALLTINAVAATVASHWHAGVVACYIVGVLLLCCGLFAQHGGKAGGVLRVVALGGAGAIAMVTTALFVGGSTDTVTYREEAVVVLGAGIIGETPSKTLADRLDVAVSYHRRNPDALIVVSGGQGSDEVISEALAMKRYLVAKGVDESVIVTEDRSASTAENFSFSKRLLDERFPFDYSAAFITSEFHVFRASHLAEQTGFIHMTHSHSNTTWYTVIPNGLREMMAIVKTWLCD